MITWSQRFRYHFDNWMAKGAIAQMGMLALLSGVMILSTAFVLAVTGLAPAGDDGSPSFAMLMWMSLMRAMDAGALGGDSGSWSYLFVNLGITLGGIFVLSTLIGVLNNTIGERLDELRKGRSLVVEQDHTIILGFTPKIGRLLTELSVANANKPNACVVVLADRDKVEMDDEIRDMLDGRKLKVVTRSGSPMSPADIEIVNPGAARAVIVLAPEGDETPTEADTAVLKSLLALTKLDLERKPHVVAELRTPSTVDVARMVTGPGAALVLSPPLISRLLVQTGRQSGLSAVYTELLDFDGNEIYTMEEPKLHGRTFRQAIAMYDTSAIIGVVRADGEVLLGPWEHVFGPGDQVIAISEDDDTVKPNGSGTTGDATVISPRPPPVASHAERTLVLGGGSPRLVLALSELDNYVGPGSQTVVVGEELPDDFDPESLTRMQVELRVGDCTDRSLLDRLDIGSFDHILALAETDGRTQDLADARTMVSLLHLRDIAQKSGKNVPITSEMLEIENQQLASVAEADDFIISNTLISLILSQLSENPKLIKVFDELFAAEGREIYLRPVGDYVDLGKPVDFYTILESAALRDEVAIGFRDSAHAKDANRGFGVVVNPKKSEARSWSSDDRIIVLANE